MTRRRNNLKFRLSSNERDSAEETEKWVLRTTNPHKNPSVREDLRPQAVGGLPTALTGVGQESPAEVWLGLGSAGLAVRRNKELLRGIAHPSGLGYVSLFGSAHVLLEVENAYSN